MDGEAMMAQPRMLTEEEIAAIYDPYGRLDGDIANLAETCRILREQLASEREHAHRLTQALHEMEGRLP